MLHKKEFSICNSLSSFIHSGPVRSYDEFSHDWSTAHLEILETSETKTEMQNKFAFVDG